MGGRHRKGHKTRKGKKMRGGVMVGFMGAEGTNGASWGGVDASRAMLPSGGEDVKTNNDFTGSRPENSALAGGKRRTRKGKSKRKSKKSMRRNRSRKMRGGAEVFGVSGGVVNSAGAGYGYGGTQGIVGSGYAAPTAYPDNLGGRVPGVDGVTPSA